MGKARVHDFVVRVKFDRPLVRHQALKALRQAAGGIDKGNVLYGSLDLDGYEKGQVQAVQLAPAEKAERPTPAAPTPNTRYRVMREDRQHAPWAVYDTVMQIVVFHWYGDTGEAKANAVAGALNALGHADN